MRRIARFASKMDGLRPPRRQQPPSHRRALLQHLRRRAARLHHRLRAIASPRRHRVPRAVNEEVPAAEEAALGAALPLRAEAERDDRRLPLLRRRLRTRPPAGHTNRTGSDRRNGSHWGAVSFCAAANCFVRVRRKSSPRSPRPRRDRRTRPPTSRTSPTPIFSHPAHSAP